MVDVSQPCRLFDVVRFEYGKKIAESSFVLKCASRQIDGWMDG